MAESIYTLRQAHNRLAGRSVGLRPEQPTTTLAQQRATQKQSDILALPQDVSFWQPLQVTSGENIGLFYFLPDYDTPGDTTKVLR